MSLNTCRVKPIAISLSCSSMSIYLKRWTIHHRPWLMNRLSNDTRCPQRRVPFLLKPLFSCPYLRCIPVRQSVCQAMLDYCPFQCHRPLSVSQWPCSRPPLIWVTKRVILKASFFHALQDRVSILQKSSPRGRILCWMISWRVSPLCFFFFVDVTCLISARQCSSRWPHPVAVKSRRNVSRLLRKLPSRVSLHSGSSMRAHRQQSQRTQWGGITKT